MPASPGDNLVDLARKLVNGQTSGPGGPGGGEVVDDTSPQLGGNLDPNGFTVGDASEADLTKLSELTATSTELNHVAGVTSPIQDQIDDKLATASVPTGLLVEGAANGDLKIWDEDAGEFVTVPMTGDVLIDEDGVTTIQGAATFEDPDTDALMKWDDSETSMVAAVPGVDYLPPLTVASKSGNYTVGTDDPNERYGGVIYVSGAAIITAPAVGVGMHFTVITVGAVEVSVDVNAADRTVLDGTALDDGDKITNLSTAGDVAVFTYESAAGWHAATNGWTDDGA